MKTTKPNTVAHFVDYLSQLQTQEQENIRIHKAIRTVLNKWENKRITRRIVEQIKQAAFPGDEGVVVYYDEAGTLLHIRIWGGTTRFQYDNHASFFLGYTGGGYGGHSLDKYVHAGAFKPESFEDSDGCNGHAAEKRCKARQALIDNPERINALVLMIEKTKVAYDAFSAFVNMDSMQELRYEAERVLGLEVKRTNNR